MNLERIILKVDEMQAAVEAILFASGEYMQIHRLKFPFLPIYRNRVFLILSV